MAAIKSVRQAADQGRGLHNLAPFVVDADCHHLWHDIDVLHPYLPRQYVEQIRDFGPMLPKVGYTNMPNNHGYRVDHAVDAESDFTAFTIREHLDAYEIDVAVLTGQMIYGVVGIPNVDYAAALCRAHNDWTLEHWVERDPRFRLTLAVGPNDPPAAAAEIDRLGEHPAVVGVMLPAGARMPYGNRFYDPIYAAAERHGLAIVTHFGGEGAGVTNAPTAAGYPSYYLEMRMARPQIAQAHAVSLICEGVFEKFPALRWLFIEVDSWWIPGMLAHFDADWKAVRDYTPWVKQLPSAYFREHIRVGTQPLEQMDSRAELRRLFEAMHAEDVLVYASDFPHWDWDEPRSTAAEIPAAMRARILGENARALFQL